MSIQVMMVLMNQLKKKLHFLVNNQNDVVDHDDDDDDDELSISSNESNIDLLINGITVKEPSKDLVQLNRKWMKLKIKSNDQFLIYTTQCKLTVGIDKV